MNDPYFINIKPKPQLRVCRGCLSSAALFALGRKVCTSLTELTGTPVTLEDGYPQFICVHCLCLTRKLIKFRARCIKATNILQRSLLGNKAAIEKLSLMDQADLEIMTFSQLEQTSYVPAPRNLQFSKTLRIEITNNTKYGYFTPPKVITEGNRTSNTAYVVADKNITVNTDVNKESSGKLTYSALIGDDNETSNPPEQKQNINLIIQKYNNNDEPRSSDEVKKELPDDEIKLEPTPDTLEPDGEIMQEQLQEELVETKNEITVEEETFIRPLYNTYQSISPTNDQNSRDKIDDSKSEQSKTNNQNRTDKIDNSESEQSNPEVIEILDLDSTSSSSSSSSESDSDDSDDDNTSDDDDDVILEEERPTEIDLTADDDDKSKPKHDLNDSESSSSSISMFSPTNSSNSNNLPQRNNKTSNQKTSTEQNIISNKETNNANVLSVSESSSSNINNFPNINSKTSNQKVITEKNIIQTGDKSNKETNNAKALNDSESSSSNINNLTNRNNKTSNQKVITEKNIIQTSDKCNKETNNAKVLYESESSSSNINKLPQRNDKTYNQITLTEKNIIQTADKSDKETNDAKVNQEIRDAEETELNLEEFSKASEVVTNAAPSSDSNKQIPPSTDHTQPVNTNSNTAPPNKTAPNKRPRRDYSTDSSSSGDDDLPDCLIGLSSDIYRKDIKRAFPDANKREKVRYVKEIYVEDKTGQCVKRSVDEFCNMDDNDSNKNIKVGDFKRIRQQFEATRKKKFAITRKYLKDRIYKYRSEEFKKKVEQLRRKRAAADV